MTIDSAVNNVAPALLAHLDEELSMLTSYLRFLQNVRALLVKSDADGLARCLEREQEIDRDAQTLRAKRERLQNGLRQALATDQEVTLREVIRHADGAVKQQLHNYRHRLLEVTEQIESLSRSNVALAGCSMELLNQMLCQITGGSVLDRYSPTGQLHQNHGRSAYQASV